MKKINIYLIVILFILITYRANAATINTGFSTNELSTEAKNTILDNINLSYIKEEPKKSMFDCFDVNVNQMIAIGYSNSSIKTVSVYSSKGIFQYGYTFNCMGDFGLEWDENNLNIYLVRSNAIVSVNSKGKILSILEVQNTTDNNSYRNHYIYSKKRTVGNTEYHMKNDSGALNVFATAYSQLVFVNEQKQETIIYDASVAGNRSAINEFIYTTCFFAVCIAVVIVVIVKYKKQKS